MTGPLGDNVVSSDHTVILHKIIFAAFVGSR